MILSRHFDPRSTPGQDHLPKLLLCWAYRSLRGVLFLLPLKDRFYRQPSISKAGSDEWQPYADRNLPTSMYLRELAVPYARNRKPSQQYHLLAKGQSQLHVRSQPTWMH